MPRINEHSLALRVCKLEGKKIQVNIGQVKEVIKCVLDELCKRDSADVNDLLCRHYVRQCKK